MISLEFSLWNSKRRITLEEFQELGRGFGGAFKMREGEAIARCGCFASTCRGWVVFDTTKPQGLAPDELPPNVEGPLNSPEWRLGDG